MKDNHDSLCHRIAAMPMAEIEGERDQLALVQEGTWMAHVYSHLPLRLQIMYLLNSTDALLRIQTLHGVPLPWTQMVKWTVMVSVMQIVGLTMAQSQLLVRGQEETGMGLVYSHLHTRHQIMYSLNFMDVLLRMMRLLGVPLQWIQMESWTVLVSVIQIVGLTKAQS